MNINTLTIKEKEILDDLKAVMQKHGTIMDYKPYYETSIVTIEDQAGLRLEIEDFDYINE